MLQLCLLLLNFGSHIDHVTKGNGKLIGAHHKGRSIGCLFGNDGDSLQIGHLLDDVIIGLKVILAHHLQIKGIFLRDILGIAYGANTRGNLLHKFDVSHEFLSFLCRSSDFQYLYHNALTFLAVVDMLPEFFRNERHERMEHFKQLLKELQCSIIGLLVNGLLISGFHHLKIPTGEFIPEQTIDGHQSLRDTVF